MSRSILFTVLQWITFCAGIALSTYFGQRIADGAHLSSITVVGFWGGTLLCAWSAVMTLLAALFRQSADLRALQSDVAILEETVRHLSEASRQTAGPSSTDI